jgi:hypothetical protein
MMGCHSVFAFLSAGIDTKANTQAAAHSKLVICVPLRMVASAEAPSSPMLFHSRLRARGGVGMVREYACQWALTLEQKHLGGGAPQVGDLRLLQDGGERGGALVSDLVVSETVRGGVGMVRE